VVFKGWQYISSLYGVECRLLMGGTDFWGGKEAVYREKGYYQSSCFSRFSFVNNSMVFEVIFIINVSF
jgi:hypothetical protein